jgi:hypothetical protein
LWWCVASSWWHHRWAHQSWEEKAIWCMFLDVVLIKMNRDGGNLYRLLLRVGWMMVSLGGDKGLLPRVSVDGELLPWSSCTEKQQNGVSTVMWCSSTAWWSS